MPSCTLNPASEEVADFIYRFGSLQNNLRDPEQFPCVDYVSNDYAIFYTPLKLFSYGIISKGGPLTLIAKL